MSGEARERIMTTGYELFSRCGVRGVGVDEVIDRSEVARATFYRHFRSKNDLVLAFLARRECDWTIGFVQSESERRGSTPEGRLLAIFDVFDEWFGSATYEGCSFINVLLEMGDEHPLGRASIEYLRTSVASCGCVPRRRRAWRVASSRRIADASTAGPVGRERPRRPSGPTWPKTN